MSLHLSRRLLLTVKVNTTSVTNGVTVTITQCHYDVKKPPKNPKLFPLKVNVVFNDSVYILTFVSITGLIVKHCGEPWTVFQGLSGASMHKM